VGLLVGMTAVAAVAFGRPDISFLWHNVIGAVVVFVSVILRGVFRTAIPDWYDLSRLMLGVAIFWGIAARLLKLPIAPPAAA